MDQVADDELILDVGPETAATVAGVMQDAGTIVWNGPLGVFEFDAFADGTRVLAEAIAKSNGFSIAGGGDTLAALDRFSASAIGCPTSPPVAARFSSSLKEKPCPRLRPSTARA